MSNYKNYFASYPIDRKDFIVNLFRIINLLNLINNIFSVNLKYVCYTVTNLMLSYFMEGRYVK